MRLDIFRTNINACTLAALMSLGICAASCSDDNNNDDDIPSGTIEPESGATLSGIVRAGQTVLLREGRTFSLSGEYLVEDGGILRIEPGVTIRAINTDDTPDYIMIAQGGQIDAQGTASDPIVMTVENLSRRRRIAGRQRLVRRAHLRTRPHQCRRRQGKF